MTSPIGTDIKIAGDLAISTSGDIQLISDAGNLKQRLSNRIQTLPKEYYFGDFGSTLKLLVDDVSPDIVNKVSQAATAAILAEPYVSQILSLNVIQTGSTIEIDVIVQTISGNSIQVQTSVGGTV